MIFFIPRTVCVKFLFTGSHVMWGLSSHDNNLSSLIQELEFPDMQNQCNHLLEVEGMAKMVWFLPRETLLASRTGLSFWGLWILPPLHQPRVLPAVQVALTMEGPRILIKVDLSDFLNTQVSKCTPFPPSITFCKPGEMYIYSSLNLFWRL